MDFGYSHEWDARAGMKGIHCITWTLQDMRVKRYRGGEPGDGDTSDGLRLSCPRVVPEHYDVHEDAVHNE